MNNKTRYNKTSLSAPPDVMKEMRRLHGMWKKAGLGESFSAFIAWAFMANVKHIEQKLQGMLK